MKKITSLFLVLMLLAVFAISAQAELPENRDDDFDKLAQLNLTEQINPEVVRSGFPKTDHVVSIAEDGTITLTINEMTISVAAPFGFKAFTQDLLAQLEDYVNTFKDPRAVVEALIQREISLLVMDLNTWEEIQVYIYQDALSSVLQNSDVEGIFEAFSKQYLTNIPDNFKRSAQTVNNRQYIRSVETLEGGELALSYLTIYGGNKILVRKYYAKDALTPDAEATVIELVEGLQFL